MLNSHITITGTGSLTKEHRQVIEDVLKSSGIECPRIVNRPLFPMRLSRSDVLKFYCGLSTEEKSAVDREVERMLRTMLTPMDAGLVWDGELPDDWPVLEGGQYSLEVDGEVFDPEDPEEVAQALQAAELELQDDGCWVTTNESGVVEVNYGSTQEAVEGLLQDGVILRNLDMHSYGGLRPAWNTVWQAPFLPVNMTPQEVYEFTGMQVYNAQDYHDTIEGYIFGVDGAGYSFMEPHLIPLIYLYGWLGN